MPVSILLADDHHVVRQGLRALLEAEPGFHVVGEAADGVETTQLVEQLRPDVLVLDLMMPSLNGLEVTQLVNQRSPGTSVIILSMYDNEAYVVEALKNGAAGYVLKNATVECLVEAVQAVIEGRRYLSPPLSEHTIETYMRKAREAPFDPYETLTNREREVLHLVAEGYTNAEIADRLFISRRTVETHRANMMRKLGLKSHIDLLRYALRRGILPPEDQGEKIP